MKKWMLALTVIGLVGCSTKTMVDPIGGKSGIDQLLVTQSADEAIQALDLTQFTGQRVAVKAVTIGEASDYVKEGLTEKAIADGAIIVPEGQAEVLIVGKIQSAGTDQYGGSLNLLNLFSSIFYRGQKIVGQVKLHIFAYRVGEPSQLVVMNQKRRNSYKEFSLFVFGPFKATTLEDWK
jgi:hypothetical protein